MSQVPMIGLPGAVMSRFRYDELKDMIAQFPSVFERAVNDWATYKAALGLIDIPANQRVEVESWYREFPRLWETVRDNWTMALPGGTFSSRKLAFAKKVDSWVDSLQADPVYRGTGLGIAPLIIAGIAIAAAFGVGGAIWAIGYVKKQNNVSRIIGEVTAGRIPAAVLEKAVSQQRGGFFADIAGAGSDLLLLSAVGVGLWLLAPTIRRSIT